jgi:DNA end-binding protein Ku
MRAPGSGILSFGLVSIPVKIHTAIDDQTVSFYSLYKKCGSRLRNRIFCPTCNETVERHDLVRGFEYSKGEYVQLTDSELEALEAEANKTIDLNEFVIESTHFGYWPTGHVWTPRASVRPFGRDQGAVQCGSRRAALRKE